MLEIGLSAQSLTKVDNTNSAIALGSGDMEVFATPAMVALMENAAAKCAAPHLEEGATTVGTFISTSHIKASAFGTEVTASATLTSIDGRLLTFSIEAREGDVLIGQGTHTRFIVYREKFMQKVAKL